jgi:hypothetical protein
MADEGKQTSEAASAMLSMMPLITGYMPSRVVHIAAQLGLADLLAAGPVSSAVLAQETKAHPQVLHRLLRALASIGVVEQLGVCARLGADVDRYSSPSCTKDVFALEIAGTR